MALIELTTIAGNIVEKLRYTRVERKDGPVARAEKREIRKLKEENEFLAEASAFSLPAVGSQQGTADEVHCESPNSTLCS